MRIPKLLSAGAALCLFGSSVRAADAQSPVAEENSVLTAVFAKTDRSYRRKKGPDGKWVREYYAMTNAGAADDTIQDNAQGRIKFVAIATVLAQHLAAQGYFPATEKDKVDLLLVVNWGRTMPFTDNLYREGVQNTLSSMNTLVQKNAATAAARSYARPGQEMATGTQPGDWEQMDEQAAASNLETTLLTQDMLNRSRALGNARAARLLGYMEDINEADGIQRFAGGGRAYDDLIADIEEARYYIILSAYDFKSTVRDQKPKLRWVTRMSMRAPGNNFAEKAAAMIAYSASRFGQNTDGLERKLYPQYKVNLEDIRFLGVADQGAAPAAQEKPEEEAAK